MYASNSKIFRWLSSVSLDSNRTSNNEDAKFRQAIEPRRDASDRNEAQRRKRQKLDKETLPSAPVSASETPQVMASGSPKKRSRDDRHEDDDVFQTVEQPVATNSDDTPRVNRFFSKQAQGCGLLGADDGLGCPTRASSASNCSTSLSNRSGPVSNRSSPSKQLRNAEIQGTGFNVGNFRMKQQQESLKQLLIQLRDIGSGHGILPASLKNELLDSDSEIPAYAFDTNEATGATTEASATNLPSLGWVQKLVRRADQCHVDRECEASWNADVHAPILEVVFRSDRFSSDALVDFRYCPSAQILPLFKPRDAPSKMVDFCVFIRPETSSAEERAIALDSSSRPGHSVNHTDLGNFCKHPIALSIETKCPSEHGDKATLQMGTWHSSQWHSLRYNRSWPSPHQSIQFLPGIIVQGHDWQFVATILDDTGKALLLRTVRLGGTETELTVYSLVVALQRLRDWIVDVYWPAFIADILASTIEILDI